MDGNSLETYLYRDSFPWIMPLLHVCRAFCRNGILQHYVRHAHIEFELRIDETFEALGLIRTHPTPAPVFAHARPITKLST